MNTRITISLRYTIITYRFNGNAATVEDFEIVASNKEEDNFLAALANAIIIVAEEIAKSEISNPLKKNANARNKKNNLKSPNIL